MTRRTLEEVMKLLGTDDPLNKARKLLSHCCAMIEQSREGPVEMRRLEFEIVEEIWKLKP